MLAARGSVAPYYEKQGAQLPERVNPVKFMVHRERSKAVIVPLPA
jgi:hypothetical protein